MDNFNDASIFWSWNESHTDLQRVITEAGGVLNISVDALENAVWTNATNNAPRLLTGVPGFPCFIETKITAWGTSGGIDNGGGIVFSRQDGTGTAAMIYLTLMRTGAVTQLIAGYGGGAFWTLTPFAPGLPLWLRICVSAYGGQNENFHFYYSTDGTAWTEIGTGPYSQGSWTSYYGLTCGLFVRNTGLLPACNMDFDYFLARRVFGPG